MFTCASKLNDRQCLDLEEGQIYGNLIQQLSNFSNNDGPYLTRLAPLYRLCRCGTNSMNSVVVNKPSCYRWKIFLITFCISSTSKTVVRHATYACNSCGKKIGDRNYTVHIIRHAFDDMEVGH